jgi:tripartite-type tricarboxylate transporter receptor subunit TctC
MSTPAYASAAVFAALVLGFVDEAAAQAYPYRPITLVVPYGAGGPNDTVGRILADRMRTSLGQPVIVENVAGGSGSIGLGRVARAAPDGYTLDLSGWATHVLNGALLPLKYDVANDFEPIALVTGNPLMIVARPTMPANNLVELISWLRANPNKALQATAGAGGAATFAGALFQRETGTNFRSIPYRGVAPALQDLTTGQTDFMIDLAANALPQAKAGAIKAYAVTAEERLEAAPNIPTTDEAGLPKFHVSQWTALWAPKGTPQAVVAKLNASIVDALADTTVRERFALLTQNIPSRERQTSAALAALHKAEIEKWWPLIKAATIKAE